MRTNTVAAAIVCTILLSVYSCNDETSHDKLDPSTAGASVISAVNSESKVEKGEYLVTIGGCNDCHSPKIFRDGMMLIDSSKLLSGHPAGQPLPPINKDNMKPGNWGAMGPGVTSFVGPWGISYAANLTSDSATGIGAWTEDAFVKAMRTGKHQGQENARPILPPMPWYNLSKAKEEDLKAMFAYLQSVPAVSNRVPAPKGVE